MSPHGFGVGEEVENLLGSAGDEMEAIEGERGSGTVAEEALEAGPHGARCLQVLEEAADLAEVVGQAVHVLGLGVAVLEDGGGDGVLVNVESEGR